MRRYFGTDGVRGVFGTDLTVELVEQLGKAATLWSGRGRVFIGRDTRGSGEELEEAAGTALKFEWPRRVREVMTAGVN